MKYRSDNAYKISQPLTVNASRKIKGEAMIARKCSASTIVQEMGNAKKTATACVMRTSTAQIAASIF